MKNHIYYRIGGHVVILYCLSFPLLDINDQLEEHKKTNPDVRVLAGLQSRFATIWNVCCQLFYATLALTIDLSILLKKDSIIPASVKQYRSIFFAGIIFPIVCGVQVFWAVYFYDRELVFKKTVEVVISQKVNFIVHTMVLLYALWELVFLPKEAMKMNTASWTHLHVFHAAYVLTTLFTRYVDIGRWPYIVLTATSGTFMFPVIFFSPWILSTLGYYLQWYLRDLVWSYRSKNRSGKQKIK